MSKKLRTPQLNTGKSIKVQAVAEPSPDQQPPVFSLRHLQRDWCITDCDKDDKAAFADRLRRLSQLSWAEIRAANKHGLGTEKIARNSIKAGIPGHVTEDVNLIALRYNGLKPMVGYREGVTFHILWLDRNFTLYDH
jgi:hypothetical protein